MGSDEEMTQLATSYSKANLPAFEATRTNDVENNTMDPSNVSMNNSSNIVRRVSDEYEKKKECEYHVAVYTVYV